MRSRLRSSASFVLLVTLAACGGGPPEASAPTPAAPVEALAARYEGTVTIAGASLAVRLDVAGPASDLEASLSIPSLRLAAHGGGGWSGDRLRLQLSYGTDCPGQARIDARAVDGSHRFEGQLVASDCTGTEEGALLLRARSGGPGEGAARPR